MTLHTGEVDPIDLVLLRTERLGRLQDAMRARNLEACLLFSEPNCRYATGSTAMPVWSMSTFARCAVVPAEGNPILFEHSNSIHRSELRAIDVRPMHPWEFHDDAASPARLFAREAVAALRELGVRDNRVGVDRIGTPALLALEAEGLKSWTRLRRRKRPAKSRRRRSSRRYASTDGWSWRHWENSRRH